MSSPSPVPSRPQFLRRAANILSSNGQPIPALQPTKDATDGPAWSQPGRREDNTLGGSIKRKFQSAGNHLRRISVSSVGSAPILNRHVRSKSEVLLTRPALRPRSPPGAAEHRTPLVIMADNNVTASDPASLDFTIPPLLVMGTPMTKVSAKKQKKIIVKLDPDSGQILYESKKQKIIPIENIKELRSGSDAHYYRQQFQLAPELEERWITIIYLMEGGYKTVHLVAFSKAVFHLWDIAVRKIYAVRKQLMSGLGNVEVRQALWEKQYWKSADQEQDRKLDFDDVEKMCHRLNINPSRDDLLRWFKTADVHDQGYLGFEDFRRFVKALKARPELGRIHKKLAASNGGEFKFSAFESFMRNTQKSTLTLEQLRQIFVKYISSPQEVSTANQSPSIVVCSEESPSPAASVTWETGVWKLQHFTTFLLSTDNSPFSDHDGKIVMDMTKPLSEYFISSSHNTYLVGHQLVGYSSIEGYIRALLHSCRSVELDVYDGDSEPMIYHGLTLTSKVSVREVCVAIMKYAFVASPYPIIISAEIHCGLVQQDMLVQIMSEVFGDALVRAPADHRPKIDKLPSPEELKGKILLKAKNLYVSESEGLRSKELTVDASSSETTTSSYETDVLSDVKSELKKVGQAINRVASKRRTSQSKSRSLPTQNLSPPSGPLLRASTTGDTSDKSKVKMSLELLSLLVYTVGVKCRGLNKKETYAPEHVFSLSESTANNILKDGAVDLIKHNKTHVVRIYPKGARIRSTNYEPHRYWAAGAQLVALNWQTCDLGIMINNAMFQRNGGAGYVLKPLALREADKQLLSRRTTHFLKVTIISAQQLPRPKDSSGREIEKGFIDPYVEVSIHAPDWIRSPFLPKPKEHNVDPSSPVGSIHGGGKSSRSVSHKTCVVKNNGFNPIWEESFALQFDCVGDMKDLVFVRFEVKQEGKDYDEPLALYVISLGSLLRGYRHLPLHDSQLSQYLFSTLFVHIDIVDA